MLNKAKGNMYQFLNDYPYPCANSGYTWNTVKGQCPHDCNYCYMKIFKLKPSRFDNQELQTDLGKGNFIFVGSSCDIWADKIPVRWIDATIHHCVSFKDNKYLFQTKNPARFIDFMDVLPTNTVLGITLETNRWFNEMGRAPNPIERVEVFRQNTYFPSMVTIEPIMDFDLDDLIKMIINIKPEWVNIGANSKLELCQLQEPSPEKVKQLVYNLRKNNIDVKLKHNIIRLTGKALFNELSLTLLTRYR